MTQSHHGSQDHDHNNSNNNDHHRHDQETGNKPKYLLSDLLRHNFYLKEKAPEDIKRNVRAQAEVIEVSVVDPWWHEIVKWLGALLIVLIAVGGIIFFGSPETRREIRGISAPSHNQNISNSSSSTPALTPEELLLQDMKEIIMQGIEDLQKQEAAQQAQNDASIATGTQD